MKSTTYLLAASLVAPVLLVLGLGAVAAAGLVTIAGLSAIVIADYGQSTEPGYAQVALAAKPTTEHLPLAA